MHSQFWVYRRNLRNNPQGFFRSNGQLMQRGGCFVSGLLGFIFFGLAMLCLFSPESDKDRNLFLSFVALCIIFQLLCFMYGCTSWYVKNCTNSDGEEEDESSSRLLHSSEDSTYEEVPGKDGIASYENCACCPEVPSYQEAISYQAGPSYQYANGYQASPSYQEVSSLKAVPNCEERGYHQRLASFRPLANYEGVFAHQQIPIYQQDLVEPQLPPYSHAHQQLITVPHSDIHVY